MIVTVFRKRMNPDAQGEYDSIAVRMNELVRTIPGYVSHKGFVAADGEQVTIVEFESEQALDQWPHSHRASLGEAACDRDAVQRIQIPDLQRPPRTRVDRESEARHSGMTGPEQLLGPEVMAH